MVELAPRWRSTDQGWFLSSQPGSPFRNWALVRETDDGWELKIWTRIGPGNWEWATHSTFKSPRVAKSIGRIVAAQNIQKL